MNFLVDTSVFIAAAYHRPYRNLLNTITRQERLLLSSIVAMELYAGFRSQAARRDFTGLHRNLHRAGRIVTPQHEDFLLGGHVLFYLSRTLDQFDFKNHFRDGLIAVSAVRLGATVVTENGRNFQLWQDGLARSGRRLVLHIVTKA